MMTEIRFCENVEIQAERLQFNTTEYHVRATHFKTAETLKKEHRRKIVDYLNMKELHNSLLQADRLIRNDLSLVAPEEFQRVKQELDLCGNPFLKYVEFLKRDKRKDRELFYQKCGFFENSLESIYKLIAHYIKVNQNERARDIAIFLTLQNPMHPSFWHALGVSLQSLKKYEGAIDAFKLVKTLNPQDPSAFIYTAECYLDMGDEAKATEEFNAVQQLIEKAPSGSWRNSFHYIQNILNK